MKTSLLFLTIFVFMVIRVDAWGPGAVGHSRAPGEDTTKCYVPQLKKYIRVGKTYYPKDQCRTMRCRNDGNYYMIEGDYCSDVAPAYDETKCRMEQDLSLRFPNCCLRVVCS